MNIQRSMKHFGRRVSDLDIDDVLSAMGLMRRRNVVISGILGAVGFLVVGAAVGAGIGLLFAPDSGKRTRESVEQRIASLREKFGPNAGAQAQQQ